VSKMIRKCGKEKGLDPFIKGVSAMLDLSGEAYETIRRISFMQCHGE